MLRKMQLIVISLCIFYAAAAAALPTAGADNASLEMIGLTYGGTACPAGSVRAVIYSTYISYLIDGIFVDPEVLTTPVTVLRENCQITLAASLPATYRMVPNAVESRGYAVLDPGVNITYSMAFYGSESSEIVSK
jgi:hypothetical protein